MSTRTVTRNDTREHSGAPKGNAKARKHGLNTLKKAVTQLGSRAIDGRSALSYALKKWRRELVEDLGGEENISTQERTIIDHVVNSKLILDSISAYVLTQRSLINARKRAVIPVVVQLQTLIDAQVRLLVILGIKRRQKVKTIDDMLNGHDEAQDRDTIVYSCVKKSGKTTLNGALTLCWGFTQEAPNEILVLANDLEQSLARVYKTMEGIIAHNPELKAEAEPQTKTIFLANGTTITAISGDYAGAAGSNHGFVSYDELWGYTSESSRRLWEELTPVPTRRNSIRFITTYAGFEGESDLLMSLYKQVVGADEHPEGQGERIHPDLPIYVNREARIFAYWDHEPRMPWQTQAYYDTQKKTLRPGTYLRLHENRWATAEEMFITPEMWDLNVDAKHHPSITSREPLYVGIDAGIKHDNAARVAVKWDENGEKLILVSHRIWKPTPSQPLDLENTVEEDLRSLNDQNDVVEVLCDPYQLHRSITTLHAAGIPIREFPQTQANCTLMGQTLFDLLTGQNLELYQSDEMRQQALSTVAVENPRGWRIAKEKASKKIDAIVAMAVACVAAMAHRGEMGSRSARGFNRSQHVSAQRLTADRSPVYIGQTLVDVPATVIAQQSYDGTLRVLAAFASEGMELRRHVETVVKPWLVTNARFALQDNRLLLGTFEDDLDEQTKRDLLQIVEDALGGFWEKSESKWEARRDAVLELIGKATPGAFRPALQIDPSAKLIVEALSGRWTYESERRERRTIWYHVANAFSLLVSSIKPAGNDDKIKVLSPLDDPL